MNKRILITGANRGLGLAMTEQLIDGGAVVYAINRHESAELQQLQKQHPDRLFLFSGDVTDQDSLRVAVAALSGGCDALDLLINNAAIHMEQSRPALEQVDFSVYLPVYQVNAVSPLMVVQVVLPLLRRGRNPLIVNVSSEAGSIGSCWRDSEYSYCMSKAALNMASRILQNALTGEGIKVLAIHPGWFSSDMGGAEAPITPAEAAQVVVKTILNPPALDGPIYVDPEGKPLDW
jgi:NAD(P)-dependent dehydrogenase (short-subunit alcohol dehydrogenase family)